MADCRNVDSGCETVKEIEALLASKAADDDLFRAGDGVDLSSHLDVFHAVLKQVDLNSLFYLLLN